jgi:hypothetical protein
MHVCTEHGVTHWQQPAKRLVPMSKQMPKRCDWRVAAKQSVTQQYLRTLQPCSGAGAVKLLALAKVRSGLKPGQTHAHNSLQLPMLLAGTGCAAHRAVTAIAFKLVRQLGPSSDCVRSGSARRSSTVSILCLTLRRPVPCLVPARPEGVVQITGTVVYSANSRQAAHNCSRRDGQAATVLLDCMQSMRLAVIHVLPHGIYLTKWASCCACGSLQNGSGCR